MIIIIIIITIIIMHWPRGPPRRWCRAGPARSCYYLSRLLCCGFLCYCYTYLNNIIHTSFMYISILFAISLLRLVVGFCPTCAKCSAARVSRCASSTTTRTKTSEIILDFQWHFPKDFQQYFPMDFHFCEFWRAIFRPVICTIPHYTIL